MRGVHSVVSRPRFDCYSAARSWFSCAEVAGGFSWAGPRRQGGEVARWQGVKVEHAYIDVLSSSGRQTIRQLLPIIPCTPVCCAQQKLAILTRRKSERPRKRRQERRGDGC